MTIFAIALWIFPLPIGTRHGATMFPATGMTVSGDESTPLTRVVDWIRDHTEPGELVAGDDPLAIFLAGREAPPALCDTSQARILSHSLTLADAADHSLAARVVVLRKGGRLSHLPGYTRWLRTQYRLLTPAESSVGRSRDVWIRRSSAAPGQRS